jgi:hypothetical protein
MNEEKAAALIRREHRRTAKRLLPSAGSSRSKCRNANLQPSGYVRLSVKSAAMVESGPMATTPCCVSRPVGVCFFHAGGAVNRR